MRGSGRFKGQPDCLKVRVMCLNPLHCGAVVASGTPWRSAARPARRLNPLHCGAVVASWRWRMPGRRSREPCLNPLHCGAVVASGSARRGGRTRAARLNPLHCGAVVASKMSRPPPHGGGASLNPLHCGAVVASPPRPAGRAGDPGVSIPFIAGQWSLLELSLNYH